MLADMRSRTDSLPCCTRGIVAWYAVDILLCNAA